MSPTRRTLLQTGGAALGLGFLSRLNSVSADEAKLDPNLVRLDSDIEPTVRLLEQSPRERVLEEVAGKIKSGLTYRELLAALMLAGVRNVQPRPAVGFKFHAVLVVNSAHLASLASPDSDRWLPIFWAIDQFKSSQAQTMKESGWRMSPVDEPKVPRASAAAKAFTDAMENWDEQAVDGAAAAVARHLSRGEAFELFARFAARDFRDIGHKTIYVANSFRTLDAIGYHHAEPVLRSLAYALLKHDGKNPAESDEAPDRPWRANAPRLAAIRPDWPDGKPDPAATKQILAALRTASSDEASTAVVEALNRAVAPQSLLDAFLCFSGELLMRRPGIVALHAVTMSNAMRYCFEASSSDQTRRTLLLQNAAFLPLFRAALGGPDKLADLRIDAFEPAEQQATVDEIFAGVERDRLAAARQALTYLNSAEHRAAALMTHARRLVFLKGNNSHDYKFSSAVLEDYHNLSPAWRQRFLASSMFYLRGASAKDNGLVNRIRAALA
jgi:hypothetical protein